jgi:exopolysaccharide biosynthesis polyprenyl glycosylphosphotransferase
MLKENWRSISRIERCFDNLIVILAFFIAYYGRSSLVYWDNYFGWQLPFEGSNLAPLKDYFFVLFIALVSYNLCLSFINAYSSMRLSTTFQLFRKFIVASTMVFFILAAVLFLLKINLSRAFIVLFCAMVALLLSIERFFVLAILRYWRRRGKNFRNIIICGTGRQALRLANEVLMRPELGIRIRGFADLRGKTDESESFIKQLHKLENLPGCLPFSKRVIPGITSLCRSLKDYQVDEVIFTDFVDVMAQVENMILICSEQGIRTTVAADLFSIGLVKSGLSYFGGMPLIHFQTPPGDRWELIVKRGLDIVLSLFALLVFSPLFVLIAIIIKLTSKGPIIFKQRRVGRNGKQFYLYKFRSMNENAEEELESLRQHNEMSGPVFKMSNDPRVTSIGRFLRRFSLDELPQLWNVLVGDMSLVGPRPPVPGEVSMYEPRDRRRLSMRPGLTCIWQVSGRNLIDDFENWVKLDLEYIDNWSLYYDLVLIFRTIPAVLFGHGAR